uniref:uncharacterized protein n=1 Tax=Myxine glutinosa TaxID=7769 RepID=UPI00358E91DB
MMGGKGDHLEEHSTDTKTCDLKSVYYGEITLKESFGKFPDVLARQTHNELYNNNSEITEKEKGLVPSTLQLARMYQHPSIQQNAENQEALPKVCISQVDQTSFQKPSPGEVQDSTGNSMVDNIECAPPDTNTQFTPLQPESVHDSLDKTYRKNMEDDFDFAGSKPSVIQDNRSSSKQQEMAQTNEAIADQVGHAARAKASPAIMVPFRRFSGFPDSDYSHWLNINDDLPGKPAETMKTNNTGFQSDVDNASPLSPALGFTFSSRPMFSFSSNDQDRKEDHLLRASTFPRVRPLFGAVSPICSSMDEKGDHGFKRGPETTSATGPPVKKFNFPFQPSSPSNDNHDDSFIFNFDGNNSSASGFSFSSPNDEKAGAMRFNFF